MTKQSRLGAAQRAELHKKIWAIADDVRGVVDGWDFKQYILGALFYRFISENITLYFNQAEHAPVTNNLTMPTLLMQKQKKTFDLAQ